MIKAASLAALAATFALMAPSSEGCTGGEPIPNVDDPKQGTQQCSVAERNVNSNGTEYLRIDCGADGQSPGSGVRSLMEATQWPMCRVGAFWPACKEG